MPVNPDHWRLPTREELQAIGMGASMAATIAWLRMLSDGAGFIKATLEACFCGALATSAGFLLHSLEIPSGYKYFILGAVKPP